MLGVNMFDFTVSQPAVWRPVASASRLLLLAAVAGDPGLEITIDVARGTVEAPAIALSATFTLEPFTTERFVNGWDDIGLTLRHSDELTEFEQSRPAFLPSTR